MPRPRIADLLAVPVAALVLAAGCSADRQAAPAPKSTPVPAAKVSFNADIRPLLNQNCTACHGGVKAAGGISFVYRDSAMQVAKKSGRPVIRPGDPAASELITRVTSTDRSYRMPPPEHGPALPADAVDKLRRWISEGAEWEEHWAFVAPKPQVPPAVRAAGAVRGPIDRFIFSRLEREGLAPAPEASRPELLRRVSLDLTGVPPTPEETAAFVRDDAPGAYERLVDRLLASPRFGERWASLWLDLARYADTKGYEKDAGRDVWQYRDWLIDAFNRNLPYDQFVIEQLAGDLLPDATIDQHVATSFHRQTQVNDEGGTDDEEYRLAALVDRVSTTWSVTSAVTFGCVQCHAHPYEPIRHAEYYKFLAWFNGTRDADFNSDYPTLRVADDPARRAAAWELRREISRLEGDVISAGRRLEREGAPWQPLTPVAAKATPSGDLTIQGAELSAAGTLSTGVVYEVDCTPADDGPVTALRLEALPVDPEKARHTPERGFIVTELALAVVHPGGATEPVKVGRFFPDTTNLNTRQVSKVPPPTPAKTNPPAPAKDAPAAPDQYRDTTLDFHFAANPTISGPRWMVAALAEPLRTLPLGARLRLTITQNRGITEKPAPIRRLRVAASADARWTDLANDAALAANSARVTAAIAELGQVPGSELPVMEELPAGEGRETRLFVRGNFLQKDGPPLAPGVPGLFPPLPDGEPPNRLTLARWFFRPDQPLTARVAVNRFWEQLFGLGLVETLEDFGSAGEKPSHPELLDWLALHFARDLGWDMKALLREIATSATYRQDFAVRPDVHARDPRNRLLARGPRQRLTAEMVRDQALAASGLLSAKMHGAPVMPPQPAGVWETVYNNQQWVEAQGEDRYRRAIYTFWKRSAAYPGFLNFDLPGRDLCTARRTPTNTPLQALVTLNDRVYHDAAAVLADRSRREAGPAADARIGRAFALVVSRAPTPAESARLLRLYQDSLAAQAPGAGEAGERAAMAAVTSAILNLDAALVR